MNTNKCPYPGLRPYNEDESIYFKGRDLHVKQITKQLEERKVVMITGASGDGKSSLVYAGVIPNARAGFFQAEYNNWKFIDFKPERNPLKTLAASLSNQLGLNENETEQQLGFGFSSLIDIYKKSEFYIDKNNDDWNTANNEHQKKRRNKAANLFILADQFEEFFTNSENFSQGNPSINAYTVVNLLIETARIANSENLPVYIVFTMRSDFISQCVAFKGLPELIGFSQFFVPRLKRNEIKQVIEEPALLAGGKISSRLTEILINELRDGFDQLPVLQHALHQLWKQASNGSQEIDLIHLANLAGMPAKYLSNSDKVLFDEWFIQLPDFHKKYFLNPELNNILNSHANYLYETSFEYFETNASWVPKNIDINDAKLILKTTFQSLTKIDEGRAVRNRMSLQEITHIINKENITYDVVCGVINIFRLPNSTFIRPFINPNDMDTQFISASTVLDITHEALIRNWELLKEWEKEELDNYNDYQEFQIQLSRWLNNDKSDQFLLTHGNLVHFEKWFKKCTPNPYWITKYDESEKGKTYQLIEAEIITDNIKDYLKKSRSFINQTEKAKKRRKNIALVSALGVILVLSVLMGFAFKEKANAQQQEQIAYEQSIEAGKQQKQAETERNKAINANKRAEVEKQRAELNAYEAIEAKAKSDKARKNAEAMRKLAEKQSLIAKQETEKAQLEKQRADKQRSLAIIASDSAHALSMLSKAQTLAFKAKQNNADKEQSLRMALQAYQINKQYGGYLRDANIFDALYNSLYLNGFDNTIYSSDKSIIALKIDNNNIQFYNSNNQLKTINDDGVVLGNKESVLNQVVANKAFILPNSVLVSHENQKTKLLKLNGDKAQVINLQTQFTQSAASNNNYLVVGSQNNTVTIYDINSNFNQPVQYYNFQSKANQIVATNDLIFTGLNSGKIAKLNTQENEIQYLDSLIGRISAMTISENGAYLIAASSKGEVLLYETNSGLSPIFSINKAGVYINAVALNTENCLFAVASSDNEIGIYDMNRLNEKPLVLMLPSKTTAIKSLTFNENDQLIVNYTDNKIRIWETNSKVYADLIESKISESKGKQVVRNNKVSKNTSN